MPVLERMMAKNPQDRYQTPAEVALALEPFTRATAVPPAPKPRPPVPAPDDGPTVHGLEALAHQLEAGGEGGAVVFHLLGVPAAADAEQHAAVAEAVRGGDLLGGMDGVALHDQADAGAELDGLGDDGRCSNGKERIVGVVVPLRQLGTAGRSSARSSRGS